MRLKKLFTAAMTAAMVSFLFVMPVSAHGHHHRQQTSNNDVCPVCTVEGCTEEGRHTHDGDYYCGYDHEDGYCDHSCENLCPVCTVEGCTEEGRHTHDGDYYCGYDHEDGYCDHSCERPSYKTVSRHGCGGRHHCH